MYKQYRNYKANLFKFEKEVRLNLINKQNNLLVLVYADGLTKRGRLEIAHGQFDRYIKCDTSNLLRYNPNVLNDVILSFSRHANKSTKEIIGFIDLSSLYDHHWFNCYVYKYIVDDHYGLSQDGVIKNVINMDKYNKLKYDDCPIVKQFTHYTTDYFAFMSSENDGEPPNVDITHFNHSDSTNYCSLDQCISEMISLYSLLNQYGFLNFTNEEYERTHLDMADYFNLNEEEEDDI